MGVANGEDHRETYSDIEHAGSRYAKMLLPIVSDMRAAARRKKPSYGG
jgi:hypothetical protein